MTNLNKHIKKQKHFFANKGLSSQNNSFSSSHVWIWELDYKEGRVLKNWCFQIVVLEKTQRTEEPGVLQSMGLQTVKHDLATEQHFVQTGQIIHPFSR